MAVVEKQPSSDFPKQFSVRLPQSKYQVLEDYARDHRYTLSRAVTELLMASLKDELAAAGVEL